LIAMVEADGQYLVINPQAMRYASTRAADEDEPAVLSFAGSKQPVDYPLHYYRKELQVPDIAALLDPQLKRATPRPKPVRQAWNRWFH
jgi:hypothetical protein